MLNSKSLQNASDRRMVIILSFYLKNKISGIQTPVICLSSVFSKCSPGASSIMWQLLEMQILRTNPDLMNQKLWGWDPAIPVLTRATGNFGATKVWFLLHFLSIYVCNRWFRQMKGSRIHIGGLNVCSCLNLSSHFTNQNLGIKP